MKNIDKKKIMILALNAMGKDPRGVEIREKIMKTEGLETEEEFREFMLKNAEIGECSVEDAKIMLNKLKNSESMDERAEIKKILSENKDNDPRTTYEIEIDTILKCIKIVDNISKEQGKDEFSNLREEAMLESGAKTNIELAKWLYDLPRGGKYSVFVEVREYLTRKLKLEFENKINRAIEKMENNLKAKEALTPEKREELRCILRRLLKDNNNPTLELIKKKSYEKYNIKSDEEFIEVAIGFMPYEIIKGYEIMEQCKKENLSYSDYREKMKVALNMGESVFNNSRSRKTNHKGKDLETLKKVAEIIENIDNTDVLYSIGSMVYSKGMAIDGTDIIAGEDNLSEYMVARGTLARELGKLALKEGLIYEDVEEKQPQEQDLDDEPVLAINDKYKTIIQ